MIISFPIIYYIYLFPPLLPDIKIYFVTIHYFSYFIVYNVSSFGNDAIYRHFTISIGCVRKQIPITNTKNIGLTPKTSGFETENHNKELSDNDTRLKS